MANNRIFLICRQCKKEGSTSFVGDGASFFIGKYFPSQGWYNQYTDTSLCSFLQKHTHFRSPFGLDKDGNVPFVLHYEVEEE